MALALSSNGLLEVPELKNGEIYSHGPETVLDKSSFCDTVRRMIWALEEVRRKGTCQGEEVVGV